MAKSLHVVDDMLKRERNFDMLGDKNKGIYRWINGKK